MGMKLADYQHLLAKVRGTQLVYLEDISGHSDDEDGFLDRHLGDEEAEPSNVLGDQRMRHALVGGDQGLAEREQQIMSMYYDTTVNLKRFAAVLGVTESRICQCTASRSRAAYHAARASSARPFATKTRA